MSEKASRGEGTVSYHVRLQSFWPALLVAATIAVTTQASGSQDLNAEAAQSGALGYNVSPSAEQPRVSPASNTAEIASSANNGAGRFDSAGWGTVGELFLDECKSFASLAAGSAPDVVTITTTLDGTPPIESPTYSTRTGTQTGRLTRAGAASVCGSVKPNPGLFVSTGSRQYDEYRFVALSSGCVTVTLRDAGDNLLWSAAYNTNGLVESDPALNYLADIANSPTAANPSKSLSFDVTGGQIFHVVVHEVNTGAGIGQSYTLDVAGVKLEPDFSVSGTLDTTSPPLSPAYYPATGQQTGRLSRTAVVSTCDAPKANPGLFSATGGRRADLYSFIPAGSGCALGSLTHSGSHSAHIVAYDQNGFNASDPSQNYLADTGSSAANDTRVFWFRVENGVPFDLAIHEVNPDAGIGDNYALTISNVPLIPKISIRTVLDDTPTPSRPEYTSSTGLQTGRLTRNGIVSTCEEPKANPGLFSASGSRLDDVYTFTPPASGCVEVTLLASNLHCAAYSQFGFDPSDPSANFLADIGSSPTVPIPRTFSFAVTAGIPFSVVVHEVNPGGGDGQQYTLEVGGIVFWRSALPFFQDGFESGGTAEWSSTVP